MNVVEHEHERLGRRQEPEQLAHCAVHAIALVLQRLAPAFGGSYQRWKDMRELRTRVVAQELQAARLEPLQVLVDCVHKHPEGQVPLQLRSAARKHEVTALLATRASSASRRVFPIP